jgi:hypothetical protein
MASLIGRYGLATSCTVGINELLPVSEPRCALSGGAKITVLAGIIGRHALVKILGESGGLGRNLLIRRSEINSDLLDTKSQNAGHKSMIHGPTAQT